MMRRFFHWIGTGPHWQCLPVFIALPFFALSVAAFLPEMSVAPITRWLIYIMAGL